jgi:hypothetical protein
MARGMPAVQLPATDYAYPMLWVGILLLVCVALLAGMSKLSASHTSAESFGQQLVFSSAVGDPECQRVTVSPTIFDKSRDHTSACGVVCAQQTDYKNIPIGAAAVGNDIQCMCCDPSTRITLKAEYKDSKPCIPRESYGTVPGQRAMFASNGCQGIFQWEDGKTVTCRSVNGGRVQCPYELNVDLANLRAAQAEENMRLSNELARREAEKKAKVKHYMDDMESKIGGMINVR